MNWLQIVASTAVQAVLLAVLAFLGRSIILHLLGKDIELHKARLSADAQRAIEAFKAELSRESLEHQVRFQALHTNQAAAIEAVYGRLVESRDTMETFVLAWQPDNQEEFFRVRSVLLELRRELDKRRIHLPEDLCAELDQCVNTLWTPTVAAGVWPRVTNDAQNHAQEFEKAIKAVSEGGSVPAAILKLERAFRKALREPAPRTLS